MTKRHRAISMRRATPILAVGVLLAAPVVAQMTIPKPASVSGDKLFGQQCGACHSTKAGETRVGPSLAGVVGRRAGSLTGYAYSAALAKSGMTWNAVSLDQWLMDTQAAVPGTNMSYAQADPAKRKAIIDYLTSIHDEH